MDGEKIGGIVIMVFCCVLCGSIFSGMSVWAKKRKDPMHFYSGTTVDPKTVSDIPAYNLENSKMWMIYSVPFWVSGVVSFFHMGAAAIIVTAACFPGFLWLIFRYKRICKKYIIR